MQGSGTLRHRAHLLNQSLPEAPTLHNQHNSLHAKLVDMLSATPTASANMTATSARLSSCLSSCRPLFMPGYLHPDMHQDADARSLAHIDTHAHWQRVGEPSFCYSPLSFIGLAHHAILLKRLDNSRAA